MEKDEFFLKRIRELANLSWQRDIVTFSDFLNLNKNRAEAARIRAEERLQHKQSMHEYYQSKIALNRAMQRLQATAKYNR